MELSGLYTLNILLTQQTQNAMQGLSRGSFSIAGEEELDKIQLVSFTVLIVERFYVPVQVYKMCIIC